MPQSPAAISPHVFGDRHDPLQERPPWRRAERRPLRILVPTSHRFTVVHAYIPRIVEGTVPLPTGTHTRRDALRRPHRTLTTCIIARGAAVFHVFGHSPARLSRRALSQQRPSSPAGRGPRSSGDAERSPNVQVVQYEVGQDRVVPEPGTGGDVVHRPHRTRTGRAIRERARQAPTSRRRGLVSSPPAGESAGRRPGVRLREHGVLETPGNGRYRVCPGTWRVAR